MAVLSKMVRPIRSPSNSRARPAKTSATAASALLIDPEDDGGTYVQDNRAGTSGDALSVIDEGRLRTIAGQLGVPYVHRAAGDPVGDMMQQARPGRVERADGDGPTAAAAELYWIFAAGSFLLALPEAVGIVRQLRGLPRMRRSGGDR